ncbi:uncharacterized protein LOC143567084 [Bidens hawaiensis]|uniref:uncharacterized protein LOC143567084 n=1 Tax=Bidens hawaiensis TaxID=980011 RepID=UPI00404A142C
MDPKDEEKTAFYTDEGTFCYTKMPFGLKNAGATYLRFMDQLFEEQRGRNMEIYVDDLVIKSKHEEGMLRDIREMFQTLKGANMKLNPGKCSFGWEEGKFLGVLVPFQNSIKDPALYGYFKKKYQEEQVLLGSKGRGSLPRTEETPMQPPYNCNPLTGRDIDTIPLPNIKNNKLCADGRKGRDAARKLRRYFQAYVVRILNDQPLQQVLSKPEVSGRLTKWAVKLGDHTLEYQPRTAIKGQVLANFLAETEGGEDNDKGEELEAGSKEKTKEGEEEPCTNNEAEYEALLAGLRIAKGIGVRKMQAHVDSLLVANQVGGTYDANDPKMQEYLKVTQGLMKEFEEAEVIHIPIGYKKADALSKLAVVAFDHLAKKVKVETLQQPSVT